MVSDI